jgi:hypothetical protein
LVPGNLKEMVARPATAGRQDQTKAFWWYCSEESTKTKAGTKIKDEPGHGKHISPAF